jgi:adenylate kinase family enzyme
MVYKRIMIFGLPGSGKSTFSVYLSQQLSLPLYHLDKYFFVENWVERPKKDFLHIQHNIVAQEHWIIDGNALSSLEIRYAHADLVLYFSTPRFLCFGRLIKRRFFRDLSIQDRAEGCQERLSYRLIRYMWSFDHRVCPLLKCLQQTYPKTPFYKIRSSQDLEDVKKLFFK